MCREEGRCVGKRGGVEVRLCVGEVCTGRRGGECMWSAYQLEVVIAYSPISTDTKNRRIGTPSMGDVMFRNQLGDMGNTRSEMRMSRRLC